MRAADLSGLAAEYAVFKANTWRLKEEYELLNSHKLNWRHWMQRVNETVGFYLSQEIGLTSYFVNPQGESAFHAAVRSNLRRLQDERIDD